jgi:hypothetical protein
LAVRSASDTDVTRLELTPAALRVITAMEQRVAAVAEQYGTGSDEHVEMLGSLVNALGHMLRLGGRITKDGELSLFGASFISYGVIFHAYRKGGDPDPLRGTWLLHS